MWNDQVGYWHYVASFSEAGFDTGYYAPNEHPAAVGFIHYDVHGPVFQALYGSVAWIVGWDLDTAAYFNMAALALGIAVFCLAARLDRRQVAAVLGLALAFWPILLYVPTASQESLQQAIAMVLAAVFSALLARRGAVSGKALAGMLALLMAVSLVRFSWALLLLPLLLLAARRWDVRTLALALGGTALAMAAVLAVFAAVSAPGGNAPLDVLADFPQHPWGTTKVLFEDAWENLGDFFGGGVEGLQAVQITALLVLAAVMVLRLRRADPSAAREWGFHLFNLGALLLASLFLYLPEGYYRVLGAHLLLSLLVMVRFRHFAVVGVVIAANLLFVPAFLDSYREWKPNFHVDRAALAKQRDRLARHLRYDPDTHSPWCNTVLLPVEQYDVRVTLVPAGMGVSYGLLDADDPLRTPVKSRYILLGHGPSGIDAALRPSRLRLLTKLPFGRLYENLDSRCGRA